MSSPPIDSRNEEIVGGLVGEGDLTTDEHNIITIEDGIIRREVRRVTRFYPGCLHATTIGIGGRCSVCDSIVCRLSELLWQMPTKPLQLLSEDEERKSIL
ncbi:MAG: hypothetical protein QXU32_07570 [Nitrososphaerales archaeon]